MPFLLLTLLCVTVFGNGYFKFGTGSINMLAVTAIITAVYYLVRFLVWASSRNRRSPNANSDKWLWAFIAYGLLVLLLSYLGLYSDLGLAESVQFDISYALRQAYYLFFLPLIIVAARGSTSLRVVGFIQSCRFQLFALVYLMCIACSRSMAISVPCCFTLAVLALAGQGRPKVSDFAMLVIVIVSPIAEGGELTQIIIRTILVIFFLFRADENLMRYGIYVMLAVIICCYFAPVLPLDELGVSVNTSWRAHYWGDELTQVLNTWGMGVGYGTSYATEDFAGVALSGPFAETEDYAALDRLFVVGCHNSFVSLTFRLGILGIALLFAYFISLVNIKVESKVKGSLSAAFAALASMVIICFNVGLESPTYLFLFVFAFAYLNSTASGEECRDGYADNADDVSTRSLFPEIRSRWLSAR